MVPHDIDRLAWENFARRICWGLATGFCSENLSDKAIHLSVVNICGGSCGTVRTTPVSVGGVVIRGTATSERVRDADRGGAVLHRDPVGAGKGAEIGVKGTILLHDDYHVLDLVDTRWHEIGAGRAA
jgi:hypothetical protein